MDDNFSPRVKDVIQFSKEEAIRLGHNYIGTEHLLLGILREGEGVAIEILMILGLDIKTLRRKVEDLCSSETSSAQTSNANIPLTKQAEKALKTTFLEAKLYNSELIGTPHLLLCILRNEADPMTLLLEQLNVTYDNVKAQFEDISEDTDLDQPFRVENLADDDSGGYLR